MQGEAGIENGRIDGWIDGWTGGHFTCKEEHCNTNIPFDLRYRAVVSWSRVKQRGVPTLTAVKIVVIWLLSMVLAVPEAIAFNMDSFVFNNANITTCMLPRPSTPFMIVSVYRTWVCECCGLLHVSWTEQRECECAVCV